MNRRDAIRALVSLPAVDRIARADLKPNSVIVVEAECALSQGSYECLRRQLQAVWPDYRIVILCEGLRLRIVDEPT